ETRGADIATPVVHAPRVRNALGFLVASVLVVVTVGVTAANATNSGDTTVYQARPTYRCLSHARGFLELDRSGLTQGVVARILWTESESYDSDIYILFARDTGRAMAVRRDLIRFARMFGLSDATIKIGLIRRSNVVYYPNSLYHFSERRRVLEQCL